MKIKKGRRNLIALAEYWQQKQQRQPLRPKCRMRSSAVPLRNAQSPLEQIVRSEAKISTVSFGADRSERSEDKKGEKNFGMCKFERTTSKFDFTTTGRVLLPIFGSNVASFSYKQIFRSAYFRIRQYIKSVFDQSETFG